MRDSPNIAIVAPGNNIYSETFIKAHKELLFGDIYFYHGNNTYFPLYLEGYGQLTLSRFDRLKNLTGKVMSKLTKKKPLINYYTIGQKKAFIRSLQKNKIDVVMAEYGQTGAICMPICRQLNIPLIVHFHGLDASVHSVIEKYREAYRKMFEYASKIIVVSSAMKDKLLALGAPSEKLILNAYGPDEAFFSVKRVNVSKDFLFIGRFVDKKAPYLTIMAFKRVAARYPEARLKMIGDGPLMGVCINMVKTLGLQDKIIFRGVCTPEKIRQEMSSSVAYVQHSVTALNGDMEGTPVAIIEASAASLPVISTFHAGISDVIEHNVTGYLVEELDVERMAEAMLEILNDPKKGCRMGIAGRERIKAEFSMDKHIGIINKAVTEVIHGK